MKTKKREIYNRLVKSIKLSKHQSYHKLFSKRNTRKTTSYSPIINRNLDVKKLKTLKNQTVNLCNNLLQINIGSVSKPRCLNFNNVLVKKFLLKNLMGSKHLDPSKFIAPKQLFSNCWFNTMFVTFFFSDKGRKFFRFFRNLMITGRKVDNSRLEDQELRKLLFIFNLYIEASYNQDSTNLIKNKVNLHEQVKNLTSNLDTNFLIKKIYNRIKKLSPGYSLPDMDEAGNPLEFYKVIMNYLKYDTLKILPIDLDINLKKKI